MATQAPLGDLPMIILTIASRREGGLLYPLPAAAGKDKRAIGRAITNLRKRSLVSEVPVENARHCWRKGKTGMTGLKVTDAGQDVVAEDAALTDKEAADSSPTVDASLAAGASEGSVTEADEQLASEEPRATKIDAVIALLQRKRGATLDELIAATGWLAHTTRAALTGLRKKGHTLTSEKVADVRRYRIVPAKTRA